MLLKQKIISLECVLPLDLINVKIKKESDEQIKRSYNCKLGSKVARGVEVKMCLDKVRMPEICREKLVDRHHELLHHGGKELMVRTIVKYFKCPGWTVGTEICASSCKLY